MNHVLPRIAALSLCLLAGLTACKNESAPAAANGGTTPIAASPAGDNVAAEIRHGDAQAKSLDYVPLPDALVQQINAYWTTEMKY